MLPPAIFGYLLSNSWIQTASVEGYCKPMSVRPGDIKDFYVSATVPYEVTYLRLTDLSLTTLVEGFPWSGERFPLLSSTRYAADFQPTPIDAWRHGCNWRTSFSLRVPSDWASDIYAAECRGSDGGVSHIIFIVKPSPGRTSDFAVLANTNTWNAYNRWGGVSRYSEPHGLNVETSFERPNPGTSPFAPYDSLYVPAGTRAEVWVLKWLRVSEYRTDIYSDYDFHSGIADMGRYKALIVSTHPEYWTLEMLDNLEGYLQDGGNLLYLGGNGIFECVQYNASASALVFLGGTPRQGRLGFLFRNLRPPRPERGILGVAFKFDNYFSEPAPYQVLRADHRFFAGTGLRNGDLVGQIGIAGATSGREMDSSDSGNVPNNDDDPVDATVAGTDRGRPPDNLQLLAVGTNEPNPYPHAAHLTYYDTDGGGFVLSAGSMMFGGSLIQDANLQKIIKNALNECLV